jgi:dTDP-4-amino-4,6-dideoxygalactose transaminase
MRAFAQIASRHRLALVEDCCQAHLSTAAGTPVGTTGLGGAFSFYPTKNLGALGDGGAVVTRDRAVAERIKRLRHGGQSSRYHHDEAGMNSRLDEIQAAILRQRLKVLPAATDRRRTLARLYRAHLPATIGTLAEVDAGHVYHLFPIRVAERDAFQAALLARGIETLIHYPVALNRQKAFAPFEPGACPEAERAAAELLSLPLHPGLADGDVLTVAAAITDLQKGRVLA